MKLFARILALVLGTVALAAQAQNLSIGTGGTGGVY
ncbi:MAG: C4-dicarboxylate ABC transporter substrate-binding protein, partial [Betaproteobacteria bacterium]|nr:C4-dicarboxylate ABC transporter substrate-binding protein [Betaproteobacteria bacterium]